MTRSIGSLLEISGDYDAIVLDQWGVLHDGSAPYPGAVAALESLVTAGRRLAVLSNSGKRGKPNAERIAAMGFPESLFEVVMTSGEALWRDVRDDRVVERKFFPIERAPGEAETWAAGLDLTCTGLEDAEAVLLMGLPDGSATADWIGTLEAAAARSLAVYCTNPDKASPRAGGVTVTSPGALAHLYAEMGGTVRYYGKPHHPVFEAVQTALGAKRLLMVGDSLEHDIAGAANAGWDTLLIEGGLYAKVFSEKDADSALAQLCDDYAAPAPTYRIARLA